jgi:hypothetical protein
VTKNASTTLEVGAVLASGATTGARLSQMATVITYVSSAPSVPVNFVSTSTSTPGIITLSWSVTSPDQDGFSIERSTDGATFTVLATTTAFSRSYINSGLSSGTYYYKIRAYNGLGFSQYATTVTTLP